MSQPNPSNRTHHTGNRASGISLGLFSAAATGSAFIFSKYIQQELSTASFVTLWFGAAGLLGMVSYGITYARRRVLPSNLPVRLLLAIGAFSGIRALAQHGAVSLGNPALIAFLARFTTVYVLLASVLLLKERLTRTTVIGSLLVITGAALISYNDTSIDIRVLLLMLVSTAAEAADIILARATGHETPRTLMAAVRGAGGMLAGVGLLAVQGPLHVPSGHLALILLLGAALSPFAGFLARYKGLRHISAWLMGILLATQPLFTLAYARVFLGQTPGLQALLGGIILTGGVLLVLIRSNSLATDQA